MKELRKFGLYLFFAGLIYLVGLLYINYIARPYLPGLRDNFNNYILIFIQLVLFSIIPLLLGILMKKNGSKIFGNILLWLSCALPFIFFSNNLYFITHPFQCNTPLKSFGSIGMHILIAVVTLVIIYIALLNINKNKAYLIISFVVIYILDLLVIQGWVFYFLDR